MKRAFQEGWDRKLQEQRMGEIPAASGLSIQVNGVSEMALAETASAVATLIKVVPAAARGVDVWRLNRALDNLTIEWVERELPHHRMLYQHGPRWVIQAQWAGSAWESTLFHTLLHFVNIAVRLPDVSSEDRDLFILHDHQHAELDYWGLEMVLCQCEYNPDD